MTENENSTVETTTEATETTQEQENKTYSAEEVAKLLQQETDRRVTAALAKQQKKHEKRAEHRGKNDQDPFLELFGGQDLLGVGDRICGGDGIGCHRRPP